MAVLSLPRSVLSAANGPGDAIQAEIEKRHDEGVQRLQEWVRQPSIAAENRGMTEGCELMMKLARDAGFQSVAKRADRRPAGRVRDARRGRAADGRASTSCTT